jgi:two-component system response regulator HydG
VPEPLLESELFGHVRGAFTGAIGERRGRFELAGTGTIFLDEIGDVSPAFQAKLLRVLQEREFFPVGSERSRGTEARVIAATHRPLEEMVRDGRFREDLYYRLNVVELVVPPLRERRDDIPLLVESLARRISRELHRAALMITPPALRRLCEHDWPGNVRELENALERAAILTRDGLITREHLPARIVDPAPVPLISDNPPANPTLEIIERAYILWVLQTEGGNKARAAEVLGIDPSTLYRKLNRYGVPE